MVYNWCPLVLSNLTVGGKVHAGWLNISVFWSIFWNSSAEGTCLGLRTQKYVMNTHTHTQTTSICFIRPKKTNDSVDLDS